MLEHKIYASWTVYLLKKGKKCSCTIKTGAPWHSPNHVNYNMLLPPPIYIFFHSFSRFSLSTIFLLLLTKSHAHRFYYFVFLLNISTTTKKILSYTWKDIPISFQWQAQYPKVACLYLLQTEMPKCLFLSIFHITSKGCTYLKLCGGLQLAFYTQNQMMKILC